MGISLAPAMESSANWPRDVGKGLFIFGEKENEFIGLEVFVFCLYDDFIDSYRIRLIWVFHGSASFSGVHIPDHVPDVYADRAKSNAAAAAHAAKFAIPLEGYILEFVHKPLADPLSGGPEELPYQALPA
jgi:hypothetical protein